jgi:hypothetical protein
MKALNNFLITCILTAFLLPVTIWLQAQDSSKKDMLVTVAYYNINNQAAYIGVHAKSKINRKFLPVGGVAFQLYLDKDSVSNAAGNVVTNEKGEGIIPLPAALKETWKNAEVHTFIAVSNGNAKYNPSRTEQQIAKAHIQLDTSDGRTITVSITELKNNGWVAAKPADVKVAIRRLGGDLAVSDKESYTTDSSGKVVAEFKRDSLPGNAAGLITLVAKVEDNDTYGNLLVEKTVPWGSIVKHENNFNKRTLYATRFRSPYWLLVMAYFIFLTVWSVLVYLIFQIIKIKKLAKDLPS